MSLRLYYENVDGHEIGRRIREMDLHCSSFMKSPPPSYDPILTPLFLSMGFTATIGATTTTVASVLSAITTTSITAGLQII